MTDVPYPETPVLDRMIQLRDAGKSELIEEFIRWLLDEKGYEIVTGYDDGEPYSLYTREGLLAEFFKVDLDAADREKGAVLEWVRSRNGLVS